jgi:hypothetical protein
MREGMSNAAVSRIVRVNRKTGRRWRYGRSVTTRTDEVRTYRDIGWDVVRSLAGLGHRLCLVEASH